MKHWLRTLSLASGIAVATSGIALAADKKVEEINFGIISTESSQNLKSTWTPFLDDMQEELGIEVNAFFASDYAGIIQGMRFGKVDVAWYGNKSAMEAVDRANGEIFAQTVDSEGNPGYWSLLIARKDNEKLNTMQDVLDNAKDLNFGNGDPNSTSGYLVPGYYVFALNGVDAKKAFKRTVNASHEVNLLSVANGQLDVATNNTESMRRLEITNPEQYAKLKVLWKSPLIPADPIVWNKELPEDVKAKIKDFFLTYGTEDAAEKEVLAALQWAPFIESSNYQLLPIRQLELFKTKQELEQNANLAEDEKAGKIAEIDKQLNELSQRQAVIEKQQAAIQ
ncbi:phosphonate ABC transporter substrate-binding protein [Allohahella marinimesophila]|uniref:Phosphonate ABC transporter substrate-binding protein n=1 Tax=Allohahella marinimesophila TaxID=1054972 RepID=A0ABP7PMU1_9GAMM